MSCNEIYEAVQIRVLVHHLVSAFHLSECGHFAEALYADHPDRSSSEYDATHCEASQHAPVTEGEHGNDRHRKLRLDEAKREHQSCRKVLFTDKAREREHGSRENQSAVLPHKHYGQRERQCESRDDRKIWIDSVQQQRRAKDNRGIYQAPDEERPSYRKMGERPEDQQFLWGMEVLPRSVFVHRNGGCLQDLTVYVLMLPLKPSDTVERFKVDPYFGNAEQDKTRHQNSENP
jgi:hypothetical protein